MRIAGDKALKVMLTLGILCLVAVVPAAVKATGEEKED